MGEEPPLLDVAREAIVKSASVDLGAEQLLNAYPDLTDDEAFQVAMAAAGKLIESAPQELQGSFTLVCVYHQYQNISRKCIARQNLLGALAAQKEITKLIQLVQ